MYIQSSFPLADTVDRAFECVYWEGAGDEQVELFASHWGGLDLDHFRRALEEGAGEEQVLAIFALGLTATEEAANLLAPFLFQAPRRQRWASAICLGLMKDPRAFPALESLLLDGLDEEGYPRAYQQEDWTQLFELDWCGVFRWHGVELLENWESPTLISLLKQAFVALWHAQQYPRSFKSFPVKTYDVLAYALGQRGDFSVLDGLDLPQEHRAMALIYLALGHLRAKAPGGPGLTGLPSYISGLENELWSNEGLRQAVARELGTHFGLSPAEQDQCLAHSYKYDDIRHEYGHLSVALLDEEEEDLDEEEKSEPVATLPFCTYQDHTARIQSIAWSPESTHLVSGSEDSTARVWSVATGETVTLFDGHTASVSRVAWSPQGHLIASGSSDSVVFVWDAWTGEQINVYRGHQSWIWGGLSWSPDGTKLASASLDGTIHVWDALSGKTLLAYHGHTGIIASLAWSPDGTRIASGGGYPECAIQIWDAQTGALQLTYRDHQLDERKQRPLFGFIQNAFAEDWARGASSVHGLAWSPDGSCIASAGLRNIYRIWDARSGKTLVASDRTNGPLAWSSDSRYLVSSPHDQVIVWDAMADRLVMFYQPQGMSEIKAVCWSPDGRLLAASGRQITPQSHPIVQVWDAALGER